MVLFQVAGVPTRLSPRNLGKLPSSEEVCENLTFLLQNRKGMEESAAGVPHCAFCEHLNLGIPQTLGLQKSARVVLKMELRTLQALR